MGHNTCKSMGRVLCVVRRYDHFCLCIVIQLAVGWQHRTPGVVLFARWLHVPYHSHDTRRPVTSGKWPQ